MFVCMYLCVCACVFFYLPFLWRGLEEIAFSYPIKQCYFLSTTRVCRNLLVRSINVRGGGGGGVGRGVVYCVRGRACMCLCSRVCGFTYRQKDDLVHKLRYDAINKLHHIIHLSFRISLYLSIHIRTHTLIHIHTFVFVCLDALTLDEEKNFIYLRLSHIKR